MCGIVGYYSVSIESEDQKNIARMTAILEKRGPDALGYKHIPIGGGGYVALGHRRLSIIDLSQDSNQPMQDVSGRYHIVFNGEVYNYRELRSELESEGVSFRTNSDTEVVLLSFVHWGHSCVNKFIGMFSFSIVDQTSRQIYFFVDRAGVKPLYIYKRARTLIFGSELKAFHAHPGFSKEVDPSSLALFFKFGYIPAPHCIYRDVQKVVPGHWMSYGFEDDSWRSVKYWDVFDCYNASKLTLGFCEAKEHLDGVLKQAFEYRMIADVPVGIFLSGGYDSTAVAAVLQRSRTNKIKTFSIGFQEQEYNEAPFAAQIATHLGTEHTELYCSMADSLEILQKLPDMFDEPMGDPSAIPTFLVSRLARKQVKVALSGDGGDEAFCGYSKYWFNRTYGQRGLCLPTPFKAGLKAALGINPALLERLYKSVPFIGKTRNVIGKIEKMQRVLSAKDLFEVYEVSNRYFEDSFVAKLIAVPFDIKPTVFNDHGHLRSDLDYTDKMMAIDYKTYMYQILTKVDRASMYASLECREPLLDHSIIEFAARLDSSHKMSGTGMKRILKAVVHDYVPETLLDRPKMGFCLPIANWLNCELRETVDKYLSPKKINDGGLLNYEMVERVRSRFYQTGTDYFPLWLVLTFQMWHEQWME
jgi:asparagine synthase (glutamine-hydrolysing)